MNRKFNVVYRLTDEIEFEMEMGGMINFAKAEEEALRRIREIHPDTLDIQIVSTGTPGGRAVIVEESDEDYES